MDRNGTAPKEQQIRHAALAAELTTLADRMTAIGAFRPDQAEQMVRALVLEAATRAVLASWQGIVPTVAMLVDHRTYSDHTSRTAVRHYLETGERIR